MRLGKYRITDKWVLGPKGFRRPRLAGGGNGSGPRVVGNPTQTVQNTGDPSLVKMNELALKEFEPALQQAGGLPGLISPRPFNQMDYGAETGPERTALNNMASFFQGPTTNEFELGGLARQQQASDPQAQLAAGRDYMDQILGPQLINQMTAAGQGRSGAVGEALAKGAAGIALPILQQSNQNAMNFGGSLLNYGQVQRGRQQDSLGGLATLAGAPRMDEANATNMGMDTLLSMLTRFPVASGQGTATSSQFIPTVRGGEPPVWQQVMGGLNSVAGIASMAMMACWVAAQLYGWDDPRKFLACFYQVNFAPKGRIARLACRVYRRWGRSWAQSRLALFLLRPIFNRVARAGARNLGVEL